MIHSNQSQLKIVHQNINWLPGKIDRLTHYLQENKPELVILTEHGLTDQNLQNTCVEGYSLIGGFSRKNHVKGGVAGYARNDIVKHTTLMYTSDGDSELICETVLFEFKFGKQPLLLLGVYRPPSANLDQAIGILSEQLERALTADKQILVMGDINVDSLVDSTEKIKIEELLIPYNITRLNLPPTRITDATATSIDWICTNIDTQHIDTEIAITGLSDHTAKIAKIFTKKTN